MKIEHELVFEPPLIIIVGVEPRMTYQGLV